MDRTYTDKQQIAGFHDNVLIGPWLVTERYTGISSPFNIPVQVPTGNMLENGPEEFQSPVVIAPSANFELDTFMALQKWEGYVISVNKGTFIARLKDLTNNYPDEQAEIEIEEIPFNDREMLCPGAVFYWSIGYNDSITGQRTRQSLIRFRRLPVWDKNEIEEAKQAALMQKDLLGW